MDTTLVDAYIKARMTYDNWDSHIFRGWPAYYPLPTWALLEQLPGYLWSQDVTIETARQAEDFINRVER